MNILKPRAFFVLIGLLTLCTSLPARPTLAANEDFSGIGDAVLKLVQTGDTNQFAASIAATMADYKKITIQTNLENPFSTNFERRLVAAKRQLTASAQALLDMQAKLHLNPAQIRFSAKETHGAAVGAIMHPWAELPWCQSVTVVLHGEPVAEADAPFRGDYTLVVSGVVKLPDGWRCDGSGVRWTKFPEKIVDSNLLAEIRINELALAYKPLTDRDDPALLKLGTNLIPFLRARDEKVFVSQAMMSIETQLEEMKQAGQKVSRKDFEEGWKWFTGKSIASAQVMAQQAKDWGIDLEKADIRVKHVVAKNFMHRGAPDAVDGLEASQMEFIFEVKSDGKSKTGKSLSGDYIVGTQQVHRNAGEWKTEGEIRWKKLPDGVLTQADAEKVEFEDYVAENGVMPSETEVPEIEFTRLDNGRKQKLSEYQGKIVLLDFWATWCGPCQQPMAEVQELIKKHPQWTNQVAFLSMSIDDTAAQVRKHIEKRGWTNSVNMWAGPGGWDATPAKQFRIHSVPTMYLIGTKGKIVLAGHLEVSEIERMIENLVK